MSSFFALRALLFAGGLFAGSTLIIALAWAAASQKTASARHLSWVVAFGGALLLPLLAAIVPSPVRILLSAPPPELPLTQSFHDAVLAPSAAAPSGLAVDASTVALALGALWLLGVCAISLRFAIGMLCLAALKHRSRPYARAPNELPKVAATHRECELRLSQSQHGPITWGVFHPVILLPSDAASWPRERLHAVLLHELAHIRRRDSLAQALSFLVCALYWPNPLIWIGARNLRREAEMAADDAVIVSGLRPSAYAGELLQLANEFRAEPAALASIPLFMASPSALEARVESVLASTTVRSGVTKMDVLKMAAAGLLATTALAFACPSLAQETPAMPDPVTVVTPPDAPTAPPMPPMPPSDVDAPATPATPEPPAPAESVKPSLHIVIDEHGLHRLRAIDRLRMHRDIEMAQRVAREAIAREKGQIEKAVAEARVSGEEAARAVREAQPEIDAAAAEVARVRPQIDEALVRAQPEIDKALEKVRAELAKAHFDADIKVRVDEALKRAEIRIEAAKVRVEQSGHDVEDPMPPNSNDDSNDD